MAWKKKGSLKGPKGDKGDPGQDASTGDVFSAAHPVGTYIETTGSAPTQGGTWQSVPRAGSSVFKRTK